MAVTTATRPAQRPGEDARLGWLPELAEELRATDEVQYLALAAALRCAIATGRIPAGTQLPSQRELAHHLGFARTTVVDACNVLRGESLLRSRQGAGTWVVRKP